MRNVLLAGLLTLAACQTAPPVDGDFCHRNAPVRLTEEQVDTLSDDQVDRILATNERGERLCGWSK